MKLAILLLFNVLFCVNCGILKRDATTPTPTEKIYLDKICKSEPTCNMIDQVSKDLQTLKTRNCMCDAECAIFGDCCSDSKYYNAAQQRQDSDAFHCSDEGVYIKRTCPTTFQDADIKLKCETGFEQKFRNTDQKLVASVTDVNTKITYENEYCARCNGITDFVVWKTSYFCWPRHYVENVTDVGIGPDGVQSEDVVKNVRFNATLGLFDTDYKGEYFTCNQYINPPSSVESASRKCVHSISKCSGTYDEQTATQCKSVTSLVYDGFVSYKNKHCAACNGIKQDLPGCILQINYEPFTGPPIILNSTVVKPRSGRDLKIHSAKLPPVDDERRCV